MSTAAETSKKELRPQITFEPVGDEKPAEAIFTQIRQKIVDGEIATGTRLPSERKMMEQFGKSRSTIREALRLLEKEGYITTVSRSSGAIVKEPGVGLVVDSLENMIQMQNLDITQVLEFRHLTETSAASLAANRRTEDDLRILSEILNRSKQAIGDVTAFTKCDFEFHMAVSQASKNELYSIMLQVCRNVIGERLSATLKLGDSNKITSRYEGILSAHQAIYSAIDEQNSELASQAMAEHLASAENDLLK